MDNTRYLQTQAYTIAGSGAIIGATSIILSSFKDIDGVDVAMTDFGTKGFATIEPASGEFEEAISFTGVVQNSNGTATLTGVKNVSFKYPYTETTGLLKSHAGGVTVIITNTAGFYDTFANKNNDETIVGTYTFSAVPNTPAAPVSGNDLTNKDYVLSVVNGGPVTYNQVVIAGTAGETLVAGNAIYLKTSDGLWYKTDADDSTTVYGAKLGIAQGAGSVGVAITGGVLVAGIDTINTGLSAGADYYIGNTAGAIVTSPGTSPRLIGKANAAGLLVLDPYITAPTIVGIQNGTYVYAADSVGTDSYAITVAPTPTTYVAGQSFTFKAGTANTGACTLAVNGGTAKAIKKSSSGTFSDLVTGDILAGQICTVVYDGTNFQITSLLANIQYSSGNFNQNIDSATGSVVVAHGLGVVPKRVRLTVTGCTSTTRLFSMGTYNGTTNSSISSVSLASTGAGTRSSTYIAQLFTTIDFTTDGQQMTATFDATNVTFAFTKVGSPSMQAYYEWEAFAN